jgi:hypothetical protein
MTLEILIGHGETANLIAGEKSNGSATMHRQQYRRILERAQSWATDPGHRLQDRLLAQALAENSAPLADGIYLDERTWEAFEQFGCYVCARLGKAHCQTGTAPDAECPLGFCRR